MNFEVPQTEKSPNLYSGKHVVLFVELAVLATALVTAWWVNQYLYAAHFETTTSEQQALDRKMGQLQQVDESSSPFSQPKARSSSNSLEPEPYLEKGAS